MRFFGEIGFGIATKVRPGVWEDVITEHQYYGDVTQNTQRMSNAGSVLTENTVQTTISVVADAFALENLTAMKYVNWAGSLWTVNSVQLQRPRLVLSLGEVYHGPTTSAPVSP